jgi:hypothetical protein
MRLTVVPSSKYSIDLMEWQRSEARAQVREAAGHQGAPRATRDRSWFRSVGMTERREIGSKVRVAIDKSNPQATIEWLAEIARADIAILGDDYTATITSYPDDTVSVHCEKKYWLRDDAA